MWKPPQSFHQTEEDFDQAKEVSDEEDDYMSDAFLNQCAEVSTDVRPGMPMSHSAKRKLEQEKRKRKVEEKEMKERQAKKAARLNPHERLTEGLATSIASDNKGFAMMAKMGYTPGTSLGKDGTGRKEPVKMVMKADRWGLGLKEILIEKRREKERKYLDRIRRRNDEFDPVKYREQKSLELNAKRNASDLVKCQRTCHMLDQEQGMQEPLEWYLWPPYLLPEQEEEELGTLEEGDENPTPEDPQNKYPEDPENPYHEDLDNLAPEDPAAPLDPWQTDMYLELASGYLAGSYNYCLWCGHRYEGEQDLERNCPGPTRQDHD